MFRRSLLPAATAAAVALVVLSVGCSAQTATQCTSHTVVATFNATQYNGTWYEYAKMGHTRFEEGGICVTAEYALSPSGDNITVINSMKDNRTLEMNSTTAWADFAGEHNEAKLNVHFPGSPVAGDYWVLSTDYTNYSIVWSCAKRPDTADVAEISWILLRTRTPSNMTLEKVEQELKNVALPSLSMYPKTEQNPAVCDGAGHVLGAILSVVLASLFALLH